MWSIEPTGGVRSLLAGVAYLLAVVGFVLLQEVGLKLRRAEQRAWWAGSGRDVLNAAGFAIIAWILHAYGFPPAGALLVGGTLTLLLFGAYVFMATQTDSPHRRLWALAVGVAVALPVLVWPGAVLGVFDRIATGLFPLPVK